MENLNSNTQNKINKHGLHAVNEDIKNEVLLNNKNFLENGNSSFTPIIISKNKNNKTINDRNFMISDNSNA